MAVPFTEDCFYHIFNRGNNRENIFLEEMNYDYFIGLLNKYLNPIAEIYCYCLLPNHFHLVLKIKEQMFLPKEISEGKRRLHQPFSNLFNAYTKAINKKYNRSGSLFQEHLKRNLIDSDKYLLNLILYVHLNPLHHGISNDFANYKYSSYQPILSNSQSFLHTKEVIEIFENRKNFIDVHRLKQIRMELLKEIMDVN